MLEVYYPADIQRALVAARWAGETTARAGTVSPEYMEGYRAALETIGLAFGLGEVAAVVPTVEHQQWPVRVLEVEG